MTKPQKFARKKIYMKKWSTLAFVTSAVGVSVFEKK